MSERKSCFGDIMKWRISGQGYKTLTRVSRFILFKPVASTILLQSLSLKVSLFVGSMEAPSKAFLLFFLLPHWLKLNHLKSRMECGFSDIFSRHFFPP